MDESQKKDKIALYEFVEELLKERPDVQLADTEKPLVVDQLVKELDYTINAHLMNLLSDDAVGQFDKLLSSNPTGEQVNKFLEDNIPNLSTEIASAMIEFKNIFLYNPDEEAKNAEGAPAPAEKSAAETKDEAVEDMLPPAPVK